MQCYAHIKKAFETKKKEEEEDEDAMVIAAEGGTDANRGSYSGCGDPLIDRGFCKNSEAVNEAIDEDDT